jgi:putative DNA methylase
VKQPPRVLIEDWLPAAAIGVECMRERGSASALAPHTFLHVWWARRPLTASRAAILGSLLPADFPREDFEKLLGFWGSSKQLLDAQVQLDWAKLNSRKIDNPHGQRAFKNRIPQVRLDTANQSMRKLWGDDIVVIDPMSGGGSIPLEAARLGLHAIANEYNPVACSILEATVDYPFRFGVQLGSRARYWGEEWRKRFNARVAKFFPQTAFVPPHCYILARTVPCPDTGFETPLVPDWHLLSPKGGKKVVAEPMVETAKGTWIEASKIAANPMLTLTGRWTIRSRDLGKEAGQLRDLPRPTYDNGKGISLFTGSPIPSDYIKAKALNGELRSAIYAVALKTPQGLQFIPPEQADLKALADAEHELKRLRPGWEKNNIIPTEEYPEVSSDDRPRMYGMPRWADMFAPRQLLCMGTLVEELQTLCPEIIDAEGGEIGEAVIHLLALGLDKFLNHNCSQNRWENTRAVIKGKMDKHDYAFKSAYAEMAPCHAGSGLSWAIQNVLEAFEAISDLPQSQITHNVQITLGSSTNLSEVRNASVIAVVVDPPYDDNVQYSEMANFFYVWLKRTQGHRRPDWFSTYLCDDTQEAVVNVSRFREKGSATRERGDTAIARAKSREFYRNLMMDTFRECRRVLRDDGVLTVMFTHKKQEAWEALFTSLIEAGFTITATWPVKTESEHSLHQAKKNAAQSTVILVARKRPPGMGKGFFDIAMKDAIHRKRNGRLPPD